MGLYTIIPTLFSYLFAIPTSLSTIILVLCALQDFSARGQCSNGQGMSQGKFIKSSKL